MNMCNLDFYGTLTAITYVCERYILYYSNNFGSFQNKVKSFEGYFYIVHRELYTNSSFVVPQKYNQRKANKKPNNGSDLYRGIKGRFPVFLRLSDISSK